MSRSPPVRPSSAARPHRPSPHVDASLVLQQQAAGGSAGSSPQKQSLRPRAHSSASHAPTSPSFHFTLANLSDSPEVLSARDGSHAPPTTPMPRSMAMAHASAPFSQAGARPRAASSQALFRPHSSASHAHRSYHNTSDSSPSANGWSSVPRRGKHERANSAVDGSGGVGASLSPGPLLFAPNLAQASPMMLPSRGHSFADESLLDEGEDGSEEEDAEREAAEAFATPRSFRTTPLTQSPAVGSSSAPMQSFRATPVLSSTDTPGGKASASSPKIAIASPPFHCSVCGASFSAKGSLVRHENAVHPAIAQSRLDEEGESDGGDEPQRASQPNHSPHTQKTFASHPELPFAMKDVARSFASPSASESAAEADPSFGLRPQGPAPSGFSPRHAHWSPATEWDERYAVEASDDDGQASVQGSPVRRPAPAVSPRIQMSPATRSASDQLVPALSWLLILTRKLVLSGAVTETQGRHIKREVLAANPRLLSAVDRFVSKEDPNAIVEALLNCLPAEGGDEEKQQQTQQPPRAGAPFAAWQDRSVNDSDSFDGDELGEEEEEEDELARSDSDAEYEAILGRGPGGHKSKAHSNAGQALGRSNGLGAQSDSDSAAASDDEENVLMVVNSLLPLDLPRLESLHGLLREMGFSLIDLETLSLCTSTLLPMAPRELIGGVGASPSPSAARDAGEQQSVPPVSLGAWQLCIKSLRLHSHAPRLFTQLLEAIYHALDLNATHSVPYGELIATVAVFCRAASHRQRLQFIYNALQRSTVTSAQQQQQRHPAASSPLSPLESDAPSLPATAAYGYIFSASLAIHVFLSVATLQLECGQDQSQALSPAQLQSVSSSVGVHNAQVWTLTNAIYALFDRQFGAQHAAAATAASASDDSAEVPDVSYQRWLTWKWHPSYVLENLLQG